MRKVETSILFQCDKNPKQCIYLFCLHPLQRLNTEEKNKRMNSVTISTKHLIHLFIYKSYSKTTTFSAGYLHWSTSRQHLAKDRTKLNFSYILTYMEHLIVSVYSYLFDHWNSISRFLLGPLLLSGSKVYSPATEPSMTTRSIWIVTLPNDFCSHKFKTLRMLSQWRKSRRQNSIT